MTLVESTLNPKIAFNYTLLGNRKQTVFETAYYLIDCVNCIIVNEKYA